MLDWALITDWGIRYRFIVLHHFTSFINNMKRAFFREGGWSHFKGSIMQEVVVKVSAAC